MNKKIIHNRIQCKYCKDIIESTHVHDYKICNCGKVSVDGGHDYCKRSFPKFPAEDHYIELSEFEYVCGNCSAKYTQEEIYKLIKNPDGESYKYCPNCGGFVSYD